MRFIKALGLAAIAAVAAMAFIGSSTASAQTHEIVLCKKIAALCPNGELWPSLSTLLLLAENTEKKSSLGTITCQDVLMTAQLSAEIGNPLTTKSLTFNEGTLPTPTLGIGCIGPCTSAEAGNLHFQLEKLEFIIETNNGLEGSHGYAMRWSGLTLLLNCPLVGTCTYRGEERVSPIQNFGNHLLHKGAENLLSTKLEEIVNRQTTHGGSVFCPSTATRVGTYTLYLVHAPSGTSGLGWLSLDRKAA